MLEKKANCLTITFLSKVTFASLNGADKDVDNINPIKKISLNNGQELPYVSSQAIRRALRDILKDMGCEISVVTPGAGKNPPKTECDPKKYIDDDLFGYMDAGGNQQRTSPIRVESLVAIDSYKGDLDFGTNLMSKKEGGNPNIFETEIHSGFYRGTILIELDRVGCEGKEGDKNYFDLSKEEKKDRLLKFLDSFRTLWSSGRQTRFLADISPKFIAAALMTAKNPIFLESVNIEKNAVNIEDLKTVTKDYEKFIKKYVFATQKAILKSSDESVKSLADGFSKIEGWIKDYYKEDAK